MIKYGYNYRNMDMYKILLLPGDWDTENLIGAPSTIYMRYSCALKYQSHDPDTTTYMEALSGENLDE